MPRFAWHEFVTGHVLSALTATAPSQQRRHSGRYNKHEHPTYQSHILNLQDEYGMITELPRTPFVGSRVNRASPLSTALRLGRQGIPGSQGRDSAAGSRSGTRQGAGRVGAKARPGRMEGGYKAPAGPRKTERTILAFKRC